MHWTVPAPLLAAAAYGEALTGRDADVARRVSRIRVGPVDVALDAEIRQPAKVLS